MARRPGPQYISATQLQGYLLEEVALALLRYSGFTPVEQADSTVDRTAAGKLFVRGRGSRHEADAIGDYRVVMPFGHPTRLIVEAKCTNKRVPLNVVRNAVGVLKDISEHYVSSASPRPSRNRYHYQYAIVSACDFTPEAQDYAFAHDIYLFPLERSRFMAPVLTALRQFTAADVRNIYRAGTETPVQDARQLVRTALRERSLGVRLPPEYGDTRTKFGILLGAAAQVGGTLLARANRHLPLQLVPRNTNVLSQIAREQHRRVRIYYDDAGWYIYDSDDHLRDEPLFSFDVPDHTVSLYRDAGLLTSDAALGLKQRELGLIEALYTPPDGPPRQIVLELDEHWLESLRRAQRGA